MSVTVRVGINGDVAFRLHVGRIRNIRQDDEQGRYTYRVLSLNSEHPPLWQVVGKVRHRRSAGLAVLVRKALALYEQKEA